MSKRRFYKTKRFWASLGLGLYLLAGFAPLFIELDNEAEPPEGVHVDRITAQTDAGPISVNVWRTGTAGGQRVIFVHGTPGDAGVWDNFLRTVPEGFEFISIDRPGFGLTEPMTPQVSLDVQAAAIAPLLDVEGGPKPILVGHSLGGPIVAAVGANYPDRVGGLLVAAGSLDPALEEILIIQYVALLPPFRWTLPAFARHTNAEIFALEDELEALTLKLEQITVPIEIIHGTKDDLVPYANVPFMERQFTRAVTVNTVTLEGQNHFLPWNSIEEIRAGIARLAERIKTDSTAAR